MFVWKMVGSTQDAASLRLRLKLWETDVKPGSVGFLGMTAGVSDEGDAVVLARYESKADAEANLTRTEHAKWLDATVALLDGPAEFAGTSDVLVWKQPGDDAQFVQVIDSVIHDRELIESMYSNMTDAMVDWRPDMLGGYTLWWDGTATDVLYFTSEADAREGEGKPMPDEMAMSMEGMEDAFSESVYVDLVEPLAL